MNSDSFPRRVRLLALGLWCCTVIVAATGCADRGDDPETEGGSPPVSDLAPDSSPIARWATDEVLRLGQLEGTAPDVFGEIRAIEVASNGDLLVFDHFGNELHRFSRTGDHLVSVGSSGEGPGEFLGVVGMAVHPSGEIWVIDGRNGRYSVVADGEVIRTAARASRVVTLPWVGGFDAEGRLHEVATASADGGSELVDTMVRISDDGSVDSEHALPRITVPTPTLGGGVMVPIPYQPRQLRAWDPRGAVWQALSSEDRLVRIDLSGDTTHVVSLGETGSPLNRAEQDSLDAAIATAESRFGVEVEAGMRPERIPILRWFTVDDGGDLWVCATGRDPCREIHVHSRETGARNVLELPAPLASSPVPIVRDDLIYGVTEGPSGEPQVFVGRIRRR